MTDSTKKDPLGVKDLPAKDAKEAGDVKGGMRPGSGRPGLTGTQATETICATGPKSEDCTC